MNKGGGIFQEWFKNLTILIFTQSFHAIFMVFILKIISTISIEQVESAAFSAEDGMLGLISIGAIWSLTKFEDLIKGIFGIKDSKFLGGIGKNFSHSMASLGSAASMAKRTIQPFQDMKKMQKENSLRRVKISQLRDNIADNDEQMKNMQEEDRKKNAGVNVKDGDNANLSASNIDGTVSYGSSQSSDENLDGGSLNVDNLTVSAQNVVDGIRISNLDGNITANNANGAGGGPMNMEQFGRMLNFQSLHEKNTKNKSMLEELELEDKKGQADYTATRRKAFARLGSTLAATAVGMGAADNIGDAAIVANAIDMPLDYISDKKIDSKTYKTAARKLNDEINTQTEALRKDLESKGYSEESIDRKVRITTRDKVDLKAEFDSKIITTPSIKNGAKMIKNAVNTVSEQGLRQTVSNIASSAKDKAGISTKYAAKLWSEHQKDKRYGQDLRMQRIQSKRKARSDKIRNIDNI